MIVFWRLSWHWMSKCRRFLLTPIEPMAIIEIACVSNCFTCLNVQTWLVWLVLSELTFRVFFQLVSLCVNNLTNELISHYRQYEDSLWTDNRLKTLTYSLALLPDAFSVASFVHSLVTRLRVFVCVCVWPRLCVLVMDRMQECNTGWRKEREVAIARYIRSFGPPQLSFVLWDSVPPSLSIHHLIKFWTEN